LTDKTGITYVKAVFGNVALGIDFWKAHSVYHERTGEIRRARE
jgi:hypothetical protein